MNIRAVAWGLAARLRKALEIPANGMYTQSL